MILHLSLVLFLKFFYNYTVRICLSRLALFLRRSFSDKEIDMKRKRNGKIVRVKLGLCFISALILSLLSACGTEKHGADVLYEFQKQLLDRAAPLIDHAEVDSKDIELDSIQYGSFSSSEAKEICAFFKYQSPKHVGGLDRTLVVIFSTDDLQVVSSHEFAADHVQVKFLPSKENTDYIFYLGATTYQGVPAYDLQLFRINGSMWEPIPTAVPPFHETGRYYLVDDSILYYCEGDSHEAYVWNREIEQFEYHPEF